jgi:hypothetical protein
MAPDVPVVRASHGDVETVLLFPPEPGQDAGGGSSAAPPESVAEAGPAWPRRRRAQGPTSHTHDHFRSCEIAVPAGIGVQELERDLQARDALRIKGFVETDEGVRLVQGVAGRIDIAVPAVPPPLSLIGRLVVIERA